MQYIHIYGYLYTIVLLFDKIKSKPGEQDGETSNSSDDSENNNSVGRRQPRRKCKKNANYSDPSVFINLSEILESSHTNDSDDIENGLTTTTNRNRTKNENRNANGTDNENENKDDRVIEQLETMNIRSSFAIGNGGSQHEIEQFLLHRQRIENMQQIRSRSNLNSNSNSNSNTIRICSRVRRRRGCRRTHFTARSKRFVVSEVNESIAMSQLLNLGYHDQSTQSHDRDRDENSNQNPLQSANRSETNQLQSKNCNTNDNNNNINGNENSNSNHGNENSNSITDNGYGNGNLNGNRAYDSRLQLQFENDDISEEKDLCTFDCSRIYSQGSTKIAFKGIQNNNICSVHFSK